MNEQLGIRKFEAVAFPPVSLLREEIGRWTQKGN